MPTTRMIDPKLWHSESMAKLTFRQRLLFIGIFSNADDQGRMRAHPSLVRSIVFPYDEVSAGDIADDLKAIESIECIRLYDDKGTQVLQVLGWWKYQHPQWAYPSNIAPMDGWNDRLRYRRGERQVVTSNWDGALPNQLPRQLPNDIPGPIELELELELEPEVVKDIDAGASNPPATKPVRAKDERKTHAAIVASRGVIGGRFPPKEIWDDLIHTLGESPDTVRLGECRKEWVVRGYNPNSWKWATEWYATGIPPRNGSKPQVGNVDRATEKTRELLRQKHGNA